MFKFINDKIALFVILSIAAAVVALVFALKNRKKVAELAANNHITDAERTKLGRLVIDDQGNITATAC